MINRVTISNYKSLGEDVVLELGRLTALVGPNSSGKSNVADALMFISDALRLGLNGAITDQDQDRNKRRGFDDIRRGGAAQGKDVSIITEGPLGAYGFTMSSEGVERGDYFVKSEFINDLEGGGHWERINDLREYSGRGWIT